MQGAIKSGVTPSEYKDVGYAVFSQSVTAATNADGTASSATINLPRNSQIIDILVDGVVVPVAGAGTATTVPVSVGTVAGGEQYVSATDLVAGGRAAPSLSAAQVAAMDDIGTSTAVVMTVDPNGTIVTTQGVYRLTVLYSPKD